MPFLILSLLLQVAFVVHILKTGRSTTWIWIVVMLPMAGLIAYLIVEILPGLSNSRAGRHARRKVRSAINPNRDINRAVREYTVSDTVENSMRLANECLNRGLAEDARELFRKCLHGPHVDDPDILFGLARAQFQLGEYAEVRETLDQLKERNPDYRNAEAHLLYARALEGMDQVAAALHEYEVLHSYYPGPEAAVYYGKFLKAQNQPDLANRIFREVLQKADHLGKQYKTLHRDLLQLARSELAG
ncbi:tetratricopeptide repeat protein [Microbulbifer hainanensis]|uniref:tetratricopeptide repeat protein n=1 Tax=Microbulbifer hainanensis TaxID=2735675 RepID=UPI001866F72F|nr:tetratricopeptide repeat protein [Microbulbifer hainanensis]